MHEDFEVRWEGVLPGTPEQVWDALTVHGIGWIWDITYEPRVGGAERGLTSGGGTVTAWEPPRRFQTRAEREDGWHNELTCTLKPHGDRTYLRYVHRSRTEDYRVEVDACARHTEFYLHSLGQYVEHFAGRDAEYVEIDAPSEIAIVEGRPPSDEQKRIYTAVYEALRAGIAEMRPGRTNKDSADALIRVFDRARWGGGATLYLHLLAPDADAAAAERAWRAAVNATEEAVA